MIPVAIVAATWLAIATVVGLGIGRAIRVADCCGMCDQ